MKKILLLFLMVFLCIGIIGCTNYENEPNYESSDLQYLLMSKSDAKLNYINTEEYNNFIASICKFSTDITEKIYHKYT